MSLSRCGLALAASLVASQVAAACEPAVVDDRGSISLAQPILAPYRLGQGFGLVQHPLLRILRAHRGLDFAAPVDTPITAPARGEVLEAHRNGEFGNYILIRHREGVETEYAHLSKYAPGIAAGACVVAGEVIGYIGTTGLSTGPHLHFALRIAGTPVDPAPHIDGLASAPQ